MTSGDWTCVDRETQQQREENYKQELQEMRQRVDSRPLLFEQTSQVRDRVDMSQVAEGGNVIGKKVLIS